MNTGPRQPGAPDTPLERGLARLLTPFEEFLRRETSAGLLLGICTLFALFLANGPLAASYEAALHLPLAVTLGGHTLEQTLHHWVNDGLMALFFFVVGLEIKRELLLGHLSDPRAAALPVIAAVGGMAAPAALYAALNGGGPGAPGWGVPMATDIAFALGVLALLGKRVPRTLASFLVALAIVDDLGAVAIIAVFYTQHIDYGALGMAGALLVFLALLNLSGVRRPLPYLLVGALVWLAMLASGVHATVAGVLVAWTVPCRPKLDPGQFSRFTRRVLARFDELARGAPGGLDRQQRRGLLQAVEDAVHLAEAPLQRLEHDLHIPVAYLVLPLFALANAGVALDKAGLAAALTEPVTLGIALGLLAGKLAGITGTSLLAARLGLGRLPEGCTARHLLGAGLLGGIGFTMSIFIAELAFPASPAMVLAAKIGILGASVLGGAAGYLVLRTGPR